MAVSELDKLRLYLKPYYQEDCDSSILAATLEDKKYSECAAAFLWGVKAGELSQTLDGITSQNNGSESVSFEKAKDRLDAAMRMESYYSQKCAERKNSGTGALIREKRPDVIGIQQDQSTWGS